MFEFSYHTVSGLKLRVMRSRSNSDKPPLIVCNGIGQSCETIQPFLEEVRDRTVFSFDAAGVGHSDTPSGFITVEQHTDLFAELLDELGIEAADIMGISWGGALAQQFAHSYPRRCRRLILAITSAGGPITLSGSPLAAMEILFPLRRTHTFWKRTIGPIVYGGEALFIHAELADYQNRNVTSGLKGYYGQIAAMVGWTSLPWLHKIENPTLVYSGLYDPLIPFLEPAVDRRAPPECRVKNTEFRPLAGLCQADGDWAGSNRFSDLIDTDRTKHALGGKDERHRHDASPTHRWSLD